MLSRLACYHQKKHSLSIKGILLTFFIGLFSVLFLTSQTNIAKAIDLPGSDDSYTSTTCKDGSSHIGLGTITWLPGEYAASSQKTIVYNYSSGTNCGTVGNFCNTISGSKKCGLEAVTPKAAAGWKFNGWKDKSNNTVSDSTSIESNVYEFTAQYKMDTSVDHTGDIEVTVTTQFSEEQSGNYGPISLTLYDADNKKVGDPVETKTYTFADEDDKTKASVIGTFSDIDVGTYKVCLTSDTDICSDTFKNTPDGVSTTLTIDEEDVDAYISSDTDTNQPTCGSSVAGVGWIICPLISAITGLKVIT